MKRFGYLLSVRQQLNLTESNLLDSPEFMWEATGATNKLWYNVCRNLELEQRLNILNKKVDYAENLQITLLELDNNKTSHRLEWIIIVLIVCLFATADYTS